MILHNHNSKERKVKSMAEMIQVTPDLLREKAGELRGYRSEHDDAINKITNLVNGLPAEFKGGAASAYVEKFNSMQSTFTNFSELLEDLARKLDVAANNFEATDGQTASQMQ